MICDVCNVRPAIDAPTVGSVESVLATVGTALYCTVL